MRTPEKQFEYAPEVFTMQPTRENVTAILSCVGARMSDTEVEAIRQRQNPFSQKRGGLGFGAYALLGPGGPESKFVNINVYTEQASLSPLTLSLGTPGGREFSLTERDGSLFMRGSLLDIPEWGRKTLSTGKPAITVLQQHGPVNLVGVLGNTRCPLFDAGNPCSFCMMDGGDANQQRTVDEILEAFMLARKDRGKYNLTLTTGRILDELTLQRMVCDAGLIKKGIGDSALAIEMAPVASDGPWYYLAALKGAGVDTCMIPLDAASRQAQERFMPGKARLLQEWYWPTVQQAVRFFGRGNVSSSLIIGLEPLEQSLTAIDQMITEGVIPEPVPVRWDNSLLQKEKPVPVTNPNDLIAARERIRELIMREEIRGTIQKTRAGCAACGGCGGIVVNRELGLTPDPAEVTKFLDILGTT